MQLEVVPIRAERRGPKLCLLRRQPALDQVVAEGDPLGRSVVAVVDALEVFGEHLLGALAGVAGGVPAMAFLAGRRVEAFVDDGVVAVALAGDVSPHACHLVSVGDGWCARRVRSVRRLSATGVRPVRADTRALAGDEARATCAVCRAGRAVSTVTRNSSSEATFRQQTRLSLSSCYKYGACRPVPG